jgi:hypothetical protein
MSHRQDPRRITWWTDVLDQLDREIARLALICQVKILDPGVVERVLKNDATVCGTDNPIAFAKLHGLLMLHFAAREKSAEMIGQVQTAVIETDVVDRLRKYFPDVGELPFADPRKRVAQDAEAELRPVAEPHSD